MQRWDLAVGVVASAIAVAGLLLSVVLGNTRAAIFGSFDQRTQLFLAALAALFGILVLVKTQVRSSRHRSQTERGCPRCDTDCRGAP